MSLIPSESENFPDSFRRKVGWHINQEAEDPKAADAVQRLVESTPAAPPSEPEPKANQESDLAPEREPAADEEHNQAAAEAGAVVEDRPDVAVDTGSPPADERTDTEPTPIEDDVSGPEVPAGDRPDEVLAQPDAPAAEPTISEPGQDVALEPLSAPPAASPTPPPIPDAAPPEPAVTPPPHDMPFRLLPDPVVKQDDSAQSRSQAQDMQALMAHFISAGVPISFARPNDELPPAPPIVADPSGLVTSIRDLPVTEPPPPVPRPNHDIEHTRFIVDFPAAVVSDPVSHELLPSAHEVPVLAQQSNTVAPVSVAEPDSISSVAEPKTPLVSPYDFWTPVSPDADLPPEVSPIRPVSPEPQKRAQEVAAPIPEPPSVPVAIPDSISIAPIGDLPVAQPPAVIVEPNGDRTPAAAVFAEVSPATIASDAVSHETSPLTEEPLTPEVSKEEISAPALKVTARAQEHPATAPADPVSPEPPNLTRKSSAPTQEAPVRIPPTKASEDVAAPMQAVAAPKLTAPLQDVVGPTEEECVPMEEVAPLEDVVEEVEEAMEEVAPLEAAVEEAEEASVAAEPAARLEEVPKQQPDVKPPQAASTPSLLSIDSPADAERILAMIAAAVQRGELMVEVEKGSNGAAASTGSPASGNTEAAPRPITSASRAEPVQPVSESPSDPPLPRPDASAKPLPAKIRIVPRRIKPRPEPETISELEGEPIDHRPNNGTAAKVEPTRVDVESPKPALASVKATAPSVKPFTPSPKAVTAPPKPVLTTAVKAAAPSAKPAAAPTRPAPTSTKPVSPAPEPVQRTQLIERREPPTSQQLATMRREVMSSDLLIFSAHERRNRWIGFGVGEFAVVAILILLGHFGFTHRFPDPTLKLLVFILLFAAAAVAVALPIAFLRNDPARWGREP